MNKFTQTKQIGSNVTLIVPSEEHEVSKLPVFLSRTDGTMYPLSQVKTIEHNQNNDTYVLTWDGATARLTASAYEKQLKPYIEVVNK